MFAQLIVFVKDGGGLFLGGTCVRQGEAKYRDKKGRGMDQKSIKLMPQVSSLESQGKKTWWPVEIIQSDVREELQFIFPPLFFPLLSFAPEARTCRIKDNKTSLSIHLEFIPYLTYSNNDHYHLHT